MQQQQGLRPSPRAARGSPPSNNGGNSSDTDDEEDGPTHQLRMREFALMYVTYMTFLACRRNCAR